MQQKWNQILPRNTGLGPYIWLAFIVLPFYFIFRYPDTGSILAGSLMVAVFSSATGSRARAGAGGCIPASRSRWPFRRR